MEERKREIERILVRGERNEVCVSQIPNMLLSLALPQRFNVLGVVQYLQFPLPLADHGFTLTLFSPFLFRLHFILCFRSIGILLHPR